MQIPRAKLFCAAAAAVSPQEETRERELLSKQFARFAARYTE